MVSPVARAVMFFYQALDIKIDLKLVFQLQPLDQIPEVGDLEKIVVVQVWNMRGKHLGNGHVN